MKLTLSSPIAYNPTDIPFDGIIAKAAQAAPGYDAAMLYKIDLGDSISLTRCCSGERPGYTEEEKMKIEQGIAVPPKPGETFSIPAGEYLFEQLPAMFNEDDLPRLLLPYATRPCEVYIRIFHENALETVMQFFFP